MRWHREHDDGTGIPDRLRWDGIPPEAAALGIVHAFLEAIEDSDEPRGPDEALFTIMADSGRRFRIELVRAFREFVAANPSNWDEPLDVAVAEPDEEPALAALAARIDARDPRSPGRSERLAALAGTLAGRLDLDPSRAAGSRACSRSAVRPTRSRTTTSTPSRASRASAATPSPAAPPRSPPRCRATSPTRRTSPLRRLVRGRRLEPARRRARARARRRRARPARRPRRLPAAAGTQFDPEVTRVYLATLGAPT